MNCDIDFVANKIMKWFERCNSSANDIMAQSHLLSLSNQTPIWNAQQRQAISAAIDYLVLQGYITANKNDDIRLTQKGYEKIHMMSQSDIIISILEKYQSGDASTIHSAEYGIDQNRLYEILDIMEKDNLISGAAIVRSGQGNKPIMGWPEDAQITLNGIQYLERYNDPIMNQTNYNIIDSQVTGSQIGTTNSQLNYNSNAISDEVNKAITEIKNLTELSDDHMKEIIDLLDQIRVAVQSGDDDAQAEAKFTLKGMLKGIGNVGVKVISVLSGLANLAKFFGFPAP